MKFLLIIGIASCFAKKQDGENRYYRKDIGMSFTKQRIRYKSGWDFFFWIKITEMISDVIEIGTGNLYGGAGSYSVHSLKPLERVIQSCKSHNISLPDPASFNKSRFDEEHGWGKERDRDFYLQ